MAREWPTTDPYPEDPQAIGVLQVSLQGPLQVLSDGRSIFTLTAASNVNHSAYECLATRQGPSLRHMYDNL